MATRPKNGCTHTKFTATVKMETVKALGTQTMVVKVQLTCSLCKEPWVFKGPIGFATSQAMVSPDGATLRAPVDYPISPEELSEEEGEEEGSTLQ